MNAIWILGAANLLSFWEVLVVLVALALFIILLRYILAVGALLLMIPSFLLTGLFYSLYKICDGVGELLNAYVESIFGGDGKQPPAPAPSPLVEEDWMRHWTEQMDAASEAHLQHVWTEEE